MEILQLIELGPMLIAVGTGGMMAGAVLTVLGLARAQREKREKQETA